MINVQRSMFNCHPKGTWSLDQCRKMAVDGGAQEIQVVAAFQEADDAPRAVFFGNSQDFLRHLGEIRIFEHQAAKRIAATGIESGGNDDQVGWKSALDFVEGVCKGGAVVFGGSAGG